MATKSGKRTDSEGSNQSLERKVQDFHRAGGSEPDRPAARDKEGEIGEAMVSSGDDLRKGRPRSSPTQE